MERVNGGGWAKYLRDAHKIDSKVTKLKEDETISDVLVETVSIVHKANISFSFWARP
jgi:hypothetical protein